MLPHCISILAEPDATSLLVRNLYSLYTLNILNSVSILNQGKQIFKAQPDVWVMSEFAFD